MGQTLTHGVYLPAEGERNCYDGLASNWNILDGAVGTIAEHTTALAGKAPAVHTHTKSDVTDLLNSNFIPSANNSYDLGSSSYQWNNVYAKNYYYNGVAWGLDKENSWSNINTYYREICISGDRTAYIAPMWAGAGSGIAFLSIDASKQFVFGQRTTDANNRSCYDATKGFLVIRTGEIGGDTIVSVIPFGTDTKLGDSNNKWKSLNGINPGALGLPSGNYDPIDTNGWDLTGATGQSYTPTVNGWLFIAIQNTAGNYLSIVSGRGAISIDGTGAQSGLRAMLPVIANESVVITVKTGVIFAARFYPMQGNVS